MLIIDTKKIYIPVSIYERNKIIHLINNDDKEYFENRERIYSSINKKTWKTLKTHDPNHYIAIHIYLSGKGTPDEIYKKFCKNDKNVEKLKKNRKSKREREEFNNYFRELIKQGIMK